MLWVIPATTRLVNDAIVNIEKSAIIDSTKSKSRLYLNDKYVRIFCKATVTA